MSDEKITQLQATFDLDEEEAEIVKGIGFEPGKRYLFSIEKPPEGRYARYGAAKGGLYVLSKKCPVDLASQYQKHPDQYEIFEHGEINGIQALVPGRDFEKFKPYLLKTANITWVHATESGQKRLVFMQLNPSEKVAVNPSHPEWESFNVKLARKLGVDIPNPPEPGSKEPPKHFNLSFLHPGVAITAEVEMVKRKGSDREIPQIDVDTIEIASEAEAKAATTTAGEQKTISEDIDTEIHDNILSLSKGCKSVSDVVKKVKEFLKESKISDPKVSGDYTTAITKMKARGEILK